MYTPGGWQSKTSILSTNVDQKSLETEFSIVVCRLFLSIFDPRLSIVKRVFDCRLPGVVYKRRGTTGGNIIIRSKQTVRASVAEINALEKHII